MSLVKNHGLAHNMSYEMVCQREDLILQSLARLMEAMITMLIMNSLLWQNLDVMATAYGVGFNLEKACPVQSLLAKFRKQLEEAVPLKGLTKLNSLMEHEIPTMQSALEGAAMAESQKQEERFHQGMQTDAARSAAAAQTAAASRRPGPPSSGTCKRGRGNQPTFERSIWSGAGGSICGQWAKEGRCLNTQCHLAYTHPHQSPPIRPDATTASAVISHRQRRQALDGNTSPASFPARQIPRRSRRCRARCCR